MDVNNPKTQKIIVFCFIIIAILFAVYMYNKKKNEKECENAVESGKGTKDENELPQQLSSDNTMITPAPNYNLKRRGYRNNNPLNIRISSNTWKNKIPKDKNTDGAFEQFTEMKWGFRAAMVNIRTHVNKNNHNSIGKLIEKWAPASDGNRPQVYAQSLVNRFPDILVSTNMLINTKDKDVMTRLAYAMACVENGDEPQWSDIYAAWELM